MKAEDLAEWQALVEAAHTYLRSHESCDVRLTVLPSFAPAYSWLIHAGAAVRRYWARDVDVAKFKGTAQGTGRPPVIQPTVSTDTFGMTEADTRRMVARFQEVSISALPVPEVFGLDGTSYEIELRSGLDSVIYHWWGSVPASWEALGRVFTQTVAELEQLRSNAPRLGAAT